MMRRIVCVSLLMLCCSPLFAQGEAPPPTTQATTPPAPPPEVKFFPGVIWGGTSYVDIRQFAAITLTTWTKTEDGSFKFTPQPAPAAPASSVVVPSTEGTPPVATTDGTQPMAVTEASPIGLGDVTVAKDGMVKGPDGKVSKVQKTIDYGEGFVFVHARLFLVFGIPIKWDDKAGVLTVAEVHRINILGPGSWYQIVKIPQGSAAEAGPKISYQTGGYPQGVATVSAGTSGGYAGSSNTGSTGHTNICQRCGDGPYQSATGKWHRLYSCAHRK